MNINLSIGDSTNEGNDNNIARIHSYPKVFAVGNSKISELFKTVVLVEEKIDGSQFSMGLLNGELVCRSKSGEIDTFLQGNNFDIAVASARTLHLHEGWVYRCEFLSKPHHNVITYSRVPKKNLIIYDINREDGSYLSYNEMVEESKRLELECVPMFFEGIISGPEQLRDMLDMQSILGGAKIEGVVVKNYSLLVDGNKVAMGKYLNEKFKEVKDSVSSNNGRDIITPVIEKFNTDARRIKAIQHLKDRGELRGDMSDLKALIKEICVDTFEEESDEMAKMLLKLASKDISRGLIKGLDNFYANYLSEHIEENSNGDPKI